jgi:hypothetical protein
VKRTLVMSFVAIVWMASLLGAVVLLLDGGPIAPSWKVGTYGMVFYAGLMATLFAATYERRSS